MDQKKPRIRLREDTEGDHRLWWKNKGSSHNVHRIKWDAQASAETNTGHGRIKPDI